MKVLQCAFEMLGIVTLRFAPVPRVWAMLLMATNIAALLFIDTIYGQVALAAVVLGVLVMLVLYSKYGFVRLLGVGHIFWIPMICWLLIEFPFDHERAYLAQWLWCLIVVNSVSLIIDAIDVARYIGGERVPHYAWK